MNIENSYNALKNHIATNLSAKGVPANYTEGLTTLINKVDDIEPAEYISVSGRVIWDDNNSGSRPAYINLYLVKDNRILRSAQVSPANSWQYTFTQAPPGSSIAGDNVNGYEAVTRGGENNSYTHTLTKLVGDLDIEHMFDVQQPEQQPEEDPVTEVPVTIIWYDDNDNRDLMRPNSVTVHLYAGGGEIDTASLSASNGWSYTFSNLPKFMVNGDAIRYTVSTDAVDQYIIDVRGYTIYLRYRPSKTSLYVRKVWDDENNSQNIRPTSIVMTLYDENGAVAMVLLNAENGWQGTIPDVLEYRNHAAIQYHWAEQSVTGYEQTNIVVNGSTTIFTNGYS